MYRSVVRQRCTSLTLGEGIREGGGEARATLLGGANGGCIGRSLQERRGTRQVDNLTLTHRSICPAELMPSTLPTLAQCIHFEQRTTVYQTQVYSAWRSSHFLGHCRHHHHSCCQHRAVGRRLPHLRPGLQTGGGSRQCDPSGHWLSGSFAQIGDLGPACPSLHASPPTPLLPIKPDRHERQLLTRLR